ncbi:DUF1834 family protein [Brevundimonas vitis]|uniref:DUF1834 family protein n=1 Tax=Brevundimonas vitisensis TaxID=2800818 RepID=A0ABX7BQ01_9CAUL|nr:phage protein Gp37 [Brevundimonas vitisensis]QQQ19673.1 DUF1834 family protein [Brevundimonas vitisensis]
MTTTPAIFIQVELAIQDRLKAASVANVLGYRLKSVESLPSDVDERIKEYVRRFPAVWTVFNGWTIVSERSGGGAIVDARYSVICAAQSQANEGAARLGAGSKPGALQIVADVIGLVLGNGHGLAAGPLELGQCQPLYSASLTRELKASLFGVSFTSRMTIDALPADIMDSQPLGNFATFAVDWIAPGAGEATLALESLQTLETPA